MSNWMKNVGTAFVKRPAVITTRSVNEPGFAAAFTPKRIPPVNDVRMNVQRNSLIVLGSLSLSSDQTGRLVEKERPISNLSKFPI